MTIPNSLIIGGSSGGGAGSPGPAGPVGVNWLDEDWNSGATYSARDAIRYGGAIYIALRTNTNAIPGLSALDWSLMLAGPGAGGIDINDIGSDAWGIDGQSNAQAWALGYNTTTLDFTDPRVMFVAGISGEANYNIPVLYVAPHRTLNTDGPFGSRVGTGFDFALARTYVKQIPLNRSVTIINGAVGSTSLVNGRWDPDTGDLANNFIARCNDFIARNPTKNRFAGLAGRRGEFDAYAHTSGYTYLIEKGRLIARYRSEIDTCDATTPYLCLDMVYDWIQDPSVSVTPTYDDVQEIHWAHKGLPFWVAYSAYVESLPGHTCDLQPGNFGAGDKIHEDADGQREIGERAAIAGLAAARANVGGWAVPDVPTLSYTVIDGTSAQVNVTAYARTAYRRFRIKAGAGAFGSWISTCRPLRKFTGLTAGVNYTVEVEDFNGTGPCVSAATITWLQIDLPAQAVVTVTGTTSSTIDASMTSTGATSYHWQILYDGDSVYTDLPSETANTIHLTSVPTGDHYLQGKGVNTYGESSLWSTAKLASVGAVPTISNLGFGEPDWVNGRLPVLMSLSGGTIDAVVFKDASNNVITPISTTANRAVLPISPASAQTVTAEGANSPSISWLAIAQPTQQPNIQAASAGTITTLANIGTNGTAFTPSTGSGLSAASINTSFLSGWKVIQHTESQMLNAPLLPLGAYHKLWVGVFTSFSGYGNFDSGYGTTPRSAFWRFAYTPGGGAANSTKIYNSHVPPATNHGPAPASANLTTNVYKSCSVSFDPALGSNQEKLLVDGVLEFQGTQSERAGTDTGSNWNGYNNLSGSGNVGYTVSQLRWEGITLSPAQDLQLVTAVLRDRGKVLGSA